MINGNSAGVVFNLRLSALRGNLPQQQHNLCWVKNIRQINEMWGKYHYTCVQLMLHAFLKGHLRFIVANVQQFAENLHEGKWV